MAGASRWNLPGQLAVWWNDKRWDWGQVTEGLGGGSRSHGVTLSTAGSSGRVCPRGGTQVDPDSQHVGAGIQCTPRSAQEALLEVAHVWCREAHLPAITSTVWLSLEENSSLQQAESCLLQPPPKIALRFLLILPSSGLTLSYSLDHENTVRGSWCWKGPLVPPQILKKFLSGAENHCSELLHPRKNFTGDSSSLLSNQGLQHIGMDGLSVTTGRKKKQLPWCGCHHLLTCILLPYLGSVCILAPIRPPIGLPSSWFSLGRETPVSSSLYSGLDLFPGALSRS